MAYHGGVTGLRGGFLGVDIFFVLSGYLITTLLLVEYSRTQTIALIAFWARRARRLLPALGVVLIGILIYATLVAKPDRLDSIRDDALSSLTYVANWRFVFSNQSYFSQFSVPSPLRHMWSLAIEEQFYFIWPLVILLLLKLRVRLAPMTMIFGAAAVASTVLMAVLFSSGSDPSRVYYGTDTRAQALLIGATLATGLLCLRGRSEKQAPSAPWVRLGLLGAVVVTLMLVFVRDTASWMYYGGYLLAALATAAVIAAAIQPRRNAIKSSLSPVWLRQIGKISYGLYLWHWPVFLTLTSGRIGVSGVVLLVIRFAVTFAIATISFYVIELPIRQQHWRKGPRKAVLVTAMAAGALAGLFIFLPIVRPTSTPNKAVAIELTGPSPPPARIWVVGDSVILGIRNELSNRRQVGLINAHVGRQAPELIAVLNKDKSRMVGAPVIVNMGNNNRLAESEVVSIFEAVKDQPQIIVINTAVPRSWKDENNSLIAQVAANYQNVKIVDWNQISEGHPEYFAPDGVHLVPTGINVFVDAVVAELK